ncbi:MAG: winged helix-turn-helix domain-containing protein [Elusimicrobiota bacterium]
MDKSIEEAARRIEEALNQEPIEVMQLKLKLEISASKLFLALGWMMREGRVGLEPSEFGYKASLAEARNSSFHKCLP